MIGRSIGSYRIVAQLGQGAMGTVYKAVDDATGQLVAIKLLRPEHTADKQLIKRLFGEYKAIKRIDNPGIVKVLDTGRSPEGIPYIVMEFLEGHTLRRYLRKSSGAMPAPQALQIAIELAEALDCAHKKGIIHRDLKPENIILVVDASTPSQLRSKVLDFGVAKQLAIAAQDATGSAHSVVTTDPGTSVGSPSYMSPEQCRSSDNIDGKADVYSLGIVLYEMLAGQLPFEGSQPVDLMIKQATSTPVALSSVAPAVPPTIATLVHWMLRKSPADRPDMAHVLTYLRVLKAPQTEPEVLAPESRIDTRVARRYPFVLWVLVPASVLFAIGVLGWLFGNAARARSARELAMVQLSCNLGAEEGCGLERRYYAQQCADGRSDYCILLGGLHEQGRGGPPEPDKAQVHYHLACSQNNSYGCFHEARLLEKASSSGTQDLISARGLYERGCSAGFLKSCVALGLMYNEARGVVRSVTNASTLFRSACAKGDMLGCNNLGDMLENGTDGIRKPEEVFELYQRACDGGVGLACDNLGRMYQHGIPGIIEQSLERAKEAYAAGCGLGNAVGCGNLAALMYAQGNDDSHNYETAFRYNQSACEHGVSGACTNLGDQYETGNGVSQDLTMAGWLYRKGCDGGNAYGCESLSQMYAKGKGLPIDSTKAATLHRQACRMKNPPRCENVDAP